MNELRNTILIDDILEPGELLNILMESKGIKNIEELSKASDVPNGTIWNILNRGIRMRYTTATQLGGVLKYPPVLLYAGILDNTYID